MRLVKPNGDLGGSSRTSQEQQSQPPVAKRERSSLDYKRGRSTQQILTTKPGKRKNPHQQQENEQQQKQQHYKRVAQTRARGSSGPPLGKWDFSDFENVDEARLFEALYSDSEREDLKANKQSGSQPRPPSNTKPRRSRQSSHSKRTPKTFSEYPDHMRDLMDGGVPVVQWVILFLLLGAALYQLRKIIILPDAKKSGVLRRNITPKKGKRKGDKAKGATSKGNLSESLSVEQAMQALNIDIEPDTEVKTSSSKKAAPSGKKKKKNIGKTKTKQKKDKLQPDLASTDGSSGGVQEAPISLGNGATTAMPLSIPMNAAVAIEETTGDNSEWQTVSKNRSPGEKTSKGPPEAPSSSSSPVPVAPSSKLNTNNELMSSEAAPIESQSAQKNKKDKVASSKKKASSEPTSDEVLARQLQREEDALNTSGSDDPNEEVWEEVATRKRKGTKSGVATA